MTGGRVAVLGETGVNFGAGMTGGWAWVWDPDDKFTGRVNTGTLEVEKVDPDKPHPVHSSSCP